MARKRQYPDLYVYMNGMRVGLLAWEAGGNLVFTYESDWLNKEGRFPISLSMPITDIPYKGEVVHNFFDNLLPDSQEIRKRIQARFSVPSSHCFDLLFHIGSDCVGALQLLTQPHAANTNKIKAISISDTEVAQLLKKYQTAPLGMDKDFDFRISIAGAQEKTALLWYQGKWCLPSGTTPTSHIIKLPIGQIKHSGIDLSESVENEWLCLNILAAYGLPINKPRIVFFQDMKTLVVERFDRRWMDNGKWLMRLPQEDMCQALGKPSALKYQSDGGPGMQDIMEVLLGSRSPIVDRKQFMKSVFLFWIMGAIDGHAKNFSIMIEGYGLYRLAPIYDVISAYPLINKRQIEWQKLKMAMSTEGHYYWRTLQLRHWLAAAGKCHFSGTIMQEIMDEVFDNMESVIEQVAQQLPPDFPIEMSHLIFDGMRQVRDTSMPIK